MADNHADPIASMKNLNEYCQRNNLKLEFKDIGTSGPPHDRRFTVEAVIGTRHYSQAIGKSKKEARHHAAQSAWEIIEQERQANLALRQQQLLLPPLLPLPPSQLPNSARNLQEPSVSYPVKYISWLNEYALKNKVFVQYNLTNKTGQDHKPIFSQECTIDGEVFGAGSGSNMQIAKQNAAKQAYEKLTGLSTCKTERGASPTNSSANSSFTGPEEASPEASENGINSECKDELNSLANQVGAIHLNGTVSSSPASPRGHAKKYKRKETPTLAPIFSKSPLQKERPCTTNARFLEDFEDIKKIGRGGYGQVFKAKHRVDKTLYAIKRVTVEDEQSEDEQTEKEKEKTEKEKAEKEVQALTKLEHENIVRYHFCWIGNDNIIDKDDLSDNNSINRPGIPTLCLFIQMQYCEKGTLVDWIEQESGKESSRNDALIKFLQIVEGVKYIHNNNFIHRDLKPSNIFISSDDKIKIGDFGLVTSGVDDLLTQRSAAIGTVTYRPPEQEERIYGKEVDIFPLGLILLEMLYPFETSHQRIKEWSDFRKGKLPEKFTKTFPREKALIKKMLLETPSKRPPADAILQYLENQTYNPHTC